MSAVALRQTRLKAPDMVESMLLLGSGWEHWDTSECLRSSWSRVEMAGGIVDLPVNDQQV